MSDILVSMWKSNADFHARFLGRPATIEEALTPFREEREEFAIAVRMESDHNVALEAADTIYTIIGACRSRGINLNMLLDAMEQVIDKNNAKTELTHYVRNDGKIARRELK